MGKITSIEVQKGDARRRSVFVDGEFAIGIGEDLAAEHGLAVGVEISEAQLAELSDREGVSHAMRQAMRFLGYRDRSVAEVRKKLAAGHVPASAIEEIVEQMSVSGLLDDRRFGREYVEARTASKPMGKARLEADLRRKGLAKEEAAEAVASIDEQSEYNLALGLAQAKMAKQAREPREMRTYLSGFLTRRGFGWDVVTKVVDDLIGDE